ncbi:SMI1/KNR4 family protein [Streptomyces spirodelae]|uniref:SMI1/KNR4 family protein n=1 Tax=Streptomyces spirodelae TaxID=2812904 RepID=A0ABS3X3Q2_9ACTN|nr:SMI1/KNR4 family protein [Streptomyces spirodelae]MBO8190013.1 SMI1/KNR4 family protein [Streptomyces spirodelae]
MGEQELLDAVDSLVGPGGQELVCGRSGHPAGHICLPVSDAIDLSTLLKAFSRRYGQLRNLAMGGYADPTVTERTGLPLLAPFAGELVEMRGWASGSRWIGCGVVRAGDGEQLVALVAEGAAPSPDAPPRDTAQPWAEIAAEVGTELPEDGSTWVQRVIESTGWKPLGLSVDWAAIEGELGVALPADYKELCEAFGGGVFSECVYFLGRDQGVSFNFLTQWRLSLSVDQDNRYGDISAVEPYAVYAPGGKGVVTWGSTEWADEYCWLIDAERPGDHPVLARSHDGGPWHRYAMSTSEFLYRVLADADFPPFGIAQYDLGATFEPGSDGPFDARPL